jgi:hypothetical protein
VTFAVELGGIGDFGLGFGFGPGADAFIANAVKIHLDMHFTEPGPA